MESIAGIGPWVGFLVFVVAMLALDLGLFRRRGRTIGAREAAAWTGAWVALAVVFNLGVYAWAGPERAMEFTAGYLIEKVLAVDNVFVFVLVFQALAIPRKYQHRVLVLGVLGAVVLRGVFIIGGGLLLERFHWLMYVFGAILIFAGTRMLLPRTHEPAEPMVVRWIRRWVPLTDGLRSQRFVVREGGRWVATPLLVALMAVEASDVVFAVDSIPAVYAVTRDPFIVFTSNIFAILGLRSMYFLLADAMHRFPDLEVGLGCVLVVVGVKMAVSEVLHIPAFVSLMVIAGILAASVLGSVITSRLWGRDGRATRDGAPSWVHSEEEVPAESQG